MAMLNLLYSWKESLKILAPKNLKLFLLITLRLALNTYKTLLLYFWWLPVLTLLLLRYNRGDSGYIILYISIFFLLFFSVVIARPSLERKDWRYFIHKMPYAFICLIFLGIFFGVVSALFGKIVIKILQGLFALYLQLQYTSSLFFADTQRALLEMRLMPLSIAIQRYSDIIAIVIFKMPLLFFSWFFVLDTSSKRWCAVPECFKAFYRAFINSFKLYIYNLPLLLIIGLLLTVGVISLFQISSWFLFMGALIVPLPLYICLLANLYTKRVHEQMDLYFK